DRCRDWRGSHRDRAGWRRAGGFGAAGTWEAEGEARAPNVISPRYSGDNPTYAPILGALGPICYRGHTTELVRNWLDVRDRSRCREGRCVLFGDACRIR